MARLCQRAAFSHAVAYTRQASALRGTADSLLDGESTRRPTAPYVFFFVPCPGGGGRQAPPVSGYQALTFSLVSGS